MCALPGGSQSQKDQLGKACSHFKRIHLTTAWTDLEDPCSVKQARRQRIDGI